MALKVMEENEKNTKNDTHNTRSSVWN
jgi:hypothetical protein